jgi:hypothetical protein
MSLRSWPRSSLMLFAGLPLVVGLGLVPDGWTVEMGTCSWMPLPLRSRLLALAMSWTRLVIQGLYRRACEAVGALQVAAGPA